MCGIFCYVCQKDENNDKGSSEWLTCKDLIFARGPDKVLEKHESLTENWIGHFAAGVLWMQGAEVVAQPIVDSDGNILLWNGDIFSGSLANDNVCDTVIMSNAFRSSPNIMTVLRKVQGPYSFIYYQKSKNLLYFGRDRIGRHSLLLKLDNEKNNLSLMSIGCKQIKGIVEVPAIGVFKMNLTNSRLNLTCYPWKEPDLRFTDIIEALETKLEVDIDIEETISTGDLSIDANLHLHPKKGEIEYLEMSYSVNFHETMQSLLEDEKTKQRVERLSELLSKAVEIRVKKKPNYCKDCVKIVLNGKDITCTHSKVGILFSGGLDSAILALIAHKYVPEHECIDLINVAFGKAQNYSRKNMTDKETKITELYDVPDRRTGRQTFLELSQLCPNRKWNLIEVNVTQEELQHYRSSRISNLLHPLCTILDESLGCAVWFASRAKGVLSMTNTVYESPCRILLLGMGADELFGGYTRHRTILKHKGWAALTEELSIELSRISERNLGRDDRVVSDHGRQSRLPYLDENVVEYVRRLKPWERCYPTEKMPTGLGDKLLLRLLAYKLGFQDTAYFPKRAFQFGSRIANSKENAKDISERL